MTQSLLWSVVHISDADKPGDAFYTGMCHRDFDGVTLVRWSDDGWLLTDAMDKPTRPLLLFIRGDETEVREALVWLKKGDLDGPCGPMVPFPTTFDSYEGGNEVCRTVPFYLNYPPYPGLEEAKLSIEIGRYFDSVELIDWVDPTESEAGSHRFLFHRSEPEAIDDTPVLEVNIDDLRY